MSREIRRVPLDWQHPRGVDGYLVPLSDGYAEAVAEWERDPEYWGARPKPERYMPDWPKGTALGWQVYESVTEGTPTSPVFATEDALVAWLMGGDAPIGIGGRPLRLTAPQARAFVASGYAPSFVFSNATGFVSGLQMPGEIET